MRIKYLDKQIEFNSRITAVKKIILLKEIQPFIHIEKDILNRADFQIFVVTSAEDIIETHRTEKADLIILQLDMEGINAEKICSFLRKDEGLKHVSILIICNNTETDIDRVQKCKANSYLTRPLRHEQFMPKVSQLLAIPDRQNYRVLLKIKVNGKSTSVPFFCYSYNISVSGMLIETEKILNKGDIIACSFFLPGADQIVTEAEVMRTVSTENGSFQYGIRYINIGLGYKASIERFIKRRTGKS
jgi:DNA-binding response OmpR family regulator